MEELLHLPWLIEPGSGRVLRRGDLLAALAGGRRPVCQPADTAEALIAITRALVQGGDLLLLDADFSRAEIQALGVPLASVNAVQTNPGARSAFAWPEVVGAAAPPVI